MEVSLIVPIYNSLERLYETLPTILDQKLSEEFEIILVNDASTDGTTSYLNSLVLPRNVTLFHHEKNSGRAITRNTGIKLATGKILVFLDSDMKVRSDFLEMHFEAYKDSDAVGFVGKIDCPPEWELTNFRKYLYRYKYRGPRRFKSNESVPFQYFVFGNSSVKRAVLEESGFFDEQISYGEDIDLAYRLYCLFPDKLRYLPEAVSYHYGHENMEKFLTGMEQFGKENVPYILNKYPELAGILAVDFVSKFDLRNELFISGLKKIFGKIVFNRPVYNFLRNITHKVPYPFSNYFIRLCVVGSVVIGYKEYLYGKSTT